MNLGDLFRKLCSQLLKLVVVSQCGKLLLEKIFSNFKVRITVVVFDHTQVELLEIAPLGFLNIDKSYIFLYLMLNLFVIADDLCLEIHELFCKCFNTSLKPDQHNGLLSFELFYLFLELRRTASVLLMQLVEVEFERFENMSLMLLSSAQGAY